ncbi:MAG: citramalate synthase [Gemmatimonadaceae bacterium]|nr:citramalate synthase [Gemmatimonadaceae bacterium]
MTTRIHLYDTTLRDGTQREGLSLSASDKVKIAARLDAFGIDTIEGGWPGSNPKDAEFFRRVKKHPPRRARIAAFGSTRRVGVSCADDPSLQALVAANTPVVTIVGKSSASHVTLVLETTREENLRLIADTVAYFVALGKEVVYDAEHFFDGLALDESYAIETIEAAHDAGASVLVLCDTNGGSEPRTISESVSRIARRTGAKLGIHPHNDRGLALANALAAIDAGCVHAQGTVNGYGERCGNLDLLALVANLQLKRGVRCVPEESLATLTELSNYVASVANLAPDAHAPFVGRAAFAHKGGIHVAAVAKDPAMYQHMDPAQVGNRMRVVVSELSGRANVRLRASSLGLDARPVERAVLEQVKAREHAGAQLEAAEGTFEMLVRRATPGYIVPFELLEYTVVVERRVEGASRARATVEMRVGGTSVRTVAEGDGPVHALDSAVRLALAPHIPAVLETKLVDYKVRIIDEHLGTAATTRVLMETAFGTERFSTIGAAANILDASWDAIRDSLELAVARAGDATSHSAPHSMDTRRASQEIVTS